MAMLREPSSKVVPYAVRAISSGRTLSGSITNAFNGSDQYYIVPFTISHHYHTDDAKKQNDRKLAKFLKSQLKSKQIVLERRMPAIPNDFPFTIKDDPNDGGETILTRDFHGEKIDAIVKMPSYMVVDEEDSDDDSNSDGDVSSDSDDADVSLSSGESKPLELKVTVSKENGKISEFKVSITADEIKVGSVLFKEPAPESSDPLLSFGPYTVEEDSDLQIASGEFLKSRGIETSHYGFLYKHMLEKYRKCPVIALKMVRNFMED